MLDIGVIRPKASSLHECCAKTHKICWLMRTTPSALRGGSKRIFVGKMSSSVPVAHFPNPNERVTDFPFAVSSVN